MDINCAWCGEPWEVDTLRHEGWSYLTQTQAEQLGVSTTYHMALCGTVSEQQAISRKVYVATLSGKGCPDVMCGFKPREGDGPHRTRQLEQLVIDSVTDDDPAMFM
jgi:hypothetical protein